MWIRRIWGQSKKYQASNEKDTTIDIRADTYRIFSVITSPVWRFHVQDVMVFRVDGWMREMCEGIGVDNVCGNGEEEEEGVGCEGSRMGHLFALRALM